MSERKNTQLHAEIQTKNYPSALPSTEHVFWCQIQLVRLDYYAYYSYYCNLNSWLWCVSLPSRVLMIMINSYTSKKADATIYGRMQEKIKANESWKNVRHKFDVELKRKKVKFWYLAKFSLLFKLIFTPLPYPVSLLSHLKSYLQVCSFILSTRAFVTEMLSSVPVHKDSLQKNACADRNNNISFESQGKKKKKNNN